MVLIWLRDVYVQEGYVSRNGGVVDVHPDTGFAFKDFTIPFWAQITELALSAQMSIADCPTVGWDIAVTESGPVLIEGNDNWEIQTVQALYGGKKADWVLFRRQFVSQQRVFVY